MASSGCGLVLASARPSPLCHCKAQKHTKWPAYFRHRNNSAQCAAESARPFTYLGMRVVSILQRFLVPGSSGHTVTLCFRVSGCFRVCGRSCPVSLRAPPRVPGDTFYSPALAGGIQWQESGVSQGVAQLVPRPPVSLKHYKSMRFSTQIKDQNTAI